MTDSGLYDFARERDEAMDDDGYDPMAPTRSEAAADDAEDQRIAARHRGEPRPTNEEWCANIERLQRETA